VRLAGGSAGQEAGVPTLFLTGGTGFIGRSVVTEALGSGFEIRALARSESAASSLSALGAEPVRGDAADPRWIDAVRGADVLIDLVQPDLPKRMTRRAMRRVADERTAATSAQLAALQGLPHDERPLYFSISGADDLEPDSRGVISHRSGHVAGDSGFAIIGVPVRRVVDESPVEATHVHFGVIVYGPGKSFADVYVQGLRKGPRGSDRLRREQASAHPRDRCGARARGPRRPPGGEAGRAHLPGRGRVRHHSGSTARPNR